MIKVFVNGIRAKSGDTKSILRNSLKVTRDAVDDYHLVFAVSDSQSYSDLVNHRVNFHDVGLWRGGSTFAIPFADNFVCQELLN